jgi:hypothetical protein
LEERKVFWRVDGAGGNTVRVQGFARDDTVREAAAAPLSAVLSGTPDVKWSIVGWDRLKPVLDGALGKHGLDRLVAKPLETRVAVEGSITPAEVKAWDALRKETSDALGASIEFSGPDVAGPTLPPTPAPAEEGRVEPPKPALPEVAEVNLSHPRRFLSSDGKWHEEGTTLDCGFTVREVFAKGVVLTRDRELVIVPLKEKGP